MGAKKCGGSCGAVSEKGASGLSGKFHNIAKPPVFRGFQTDNERLRA